jgi:hypothetical protein
VARRSCEVTIRWQNGNRSYTTVVEAESTYDAAVVFQKHCENSPSQLNLPKIDYTSVVEVKPIYRINARKARIRAVEKEARKGRGRPQR